MREAEVLVPWLVYPQTAVCTLFILGLFFLPYYTASGSYTKCCSEAAAWICLQQVLLALYVMCFSIWQCFQFLIVPGALF